MINEGYRQDYKPLGDASREVYLKTGQWVKAQEIASYFEDKQAIQDIIAFRRWQRFGWPTNCWGDCSNPYVELIEALLLTEQAYHPAEAVYGRQ